MSSGQQFDSLSVGETAELLRRQADDRIDVLLRRLAETGKPSQCKVGCTACCRQLVMVSPLEAHSIRKFLQNRPELRSSLEPRLGAWRQTIAANVWLAEKLDELAAAGGYPEPEAGGEIEEAYWAARLPCPFLSEGLCSIYEARPFACREHHVVSEPEFCQIELDRPEPAGIRLEYRTLAAFLGSSVYFLPDLLLPLPVALEYADANPEEGDREAEERQVYDAAEEAQERLSAALRHLGIEPPFG